MEKTLRDKDIRQILAEDIKEFCGWKDGFICAKGNDFDTAILGTTICHLHDYQELLQVKQAREANEKE
jgi:hypothetical protein